MQAKMSFAEYDNGSLVEPEVKMWNGKLGTENCQHDKIVIRVEIVYWHSLMLKIIRSTPKA